MGVISRPRAVVAEMDLLCDEVLALILKKLRILDVIRARAVCKNWRGRINAERIQFQSLGYCPLAFERSEGQHTWSGYHLATNKWAPLPSLSNVPRVVHLVPIPGSGIHGLLGFKISQEYSSYIVGNPYSQKWTTLPRSADCWGDAAMFMTTTHDGFRVVAVRVEDTHIYKSEMDTWTKVGCSPQGQAVSRSIRHKVCAFVNNRLYTTDGNVVISFDMRTEKWTNERISIPVGTKTLQLAACAGTLFAVTEEGNTGQISVWGLGILSHRFSLTVEMPGEMQGSRSRAKLRSVGHGQQLFFWRHNSLRVASYDVVTREWRQLPEIVAQADIVADDGPQIAIDTGFFEPKCNFANLPELNLSLQVGYG